MIDRSPSTEAGRALLAYSKGLPTLFITPTWLEGILAIETEARAPLREALRDAFREAEARIEAEPRAEGTICKCGSAKSYHAARFKPNHEYEPRYPAEPEGLREAAQAFIDEWTQTISEGGLVTIALADPDLFTLIGTTFDALRAALEEPPT